MELVITKTHLGGGKSYDHGYTHTCGSGILQRLCDPAAHKKQKES